MDTDLIKLVNKLQDTFANLGECRDIPTKNVRTETALMIIVGGELDMPQLAVVRGRVGPSR